MLLIVEYGSLNSQAVIGQGVTTLTDDALTNMSLITGGTSSLGNKSGKATGVDGKVSISYRGVENFWGNIWKWVDGYNINNGQSYLSNINGNFTSNVFTGQYVYVGFLNATANGYISKVGLSNSHDFGFIPTEVLGTSSSRFSDYFYQIGAGDFVARLGGVWHYGVGTGAFVWALDAGSAIRSRIFGARLCA